MTVFDNIHSSGGRVANNPDQSTASFSASNPKLENAAHQFEASLMQELFAPLQKDSMSTPDGDGDSGSGDALSSFAGEAMARAISDQGGFGIARQLIQHFEKSGTEDV